jgi:hypothetical protein
MTTTRKRKTPPKPKDPKVNGGSREGAGRRPTFGEKLDAMSMIKFTSAQKAALTAYVEKLNKDRAKNGLAAVGLGTWLRELGLKESGNSDLGFAGFEDLAEKFGEVV